MGNHDSYSDRVQSRANDLAAVLKSTGHSASDESSREDSTWFLCCKYCKNGRGRWVGVDYIEGAL